MPDREKVITHFRDAIEASGCDNKWRFVRVDILEEAIALLKEQDTVEHALSVLKAHGWQDGGEAVKPQPTGIEPNYNCGNCRMPIQQGYPFCPWCGREVEWDEP